MVRVIIGAYHKTGSSLIRALFGNYARYDKNFKFRMVDHFNKVAERDIVGSKCIVLIRHPMEIVMSGMRYHQIAKKQQEGWLYTPTPEWGGQTYYSRLHTCPTPEDKIMFEMNNCAKDTILDIYNDVKYRNKTGNILFLHLEDLCYLPSLARCCQTIAQHLGGMISIRYLYQAFATGIRTIHNPTNRSRRHTWPAAFRPEHYTAFNRLFPIDTLAVLGYAAN